MTTAKQENPCAMRGTLCNFICFLSDFLRTNAALLKASQISWPRKDFSVTVINLLVSKGCLFAKQRNYTMLFNFTSHSAVTRFA